MNLTRRTGKRSATGFVNALLRTISRQRDRLPFLHDRRIPRSDRRARLPQHRAVPSSLAGRPVNERLGFEATEAWLIFNNAPAPLTLRANPLN